MQRLQYKSSSTPIVGLQGENEIDRIAFKKLLRSFRDVARALIRFCKHLVLIPKKHVYTTNKM